MLLDPISKNIQPSFRPALRNEILRFATAHLRLKRPLSKSEPEDIESLRRSASFSAAKLKNEPFCISNEVISEIASNPEPWINEIYDLL
jgi:hypothetical protein